MAAPSRRWPKSEIALAFVLASVSAQEPKRMPHTGKVFGAGGGAEPGAAVTFFGAPVQRDEPGDVVQATADADGRFRVGLLPGLPYVAWAARQTAWGVRVTAPIDRGALQTEITFTRDDAIALAHVHVGGVAAWREHGVIRVRLAASAGGGVVTEATVENDGDVAIPPTANVPLRASFFCDDRFVWETFVEGDVDLPPPLRIRLRALDANDAPVPGVSIARYVYGEGRCVGPLSSTLPGRRHRVATTDADGAASVLLADEPFATQRFAVVLVASGEGLVDKVLRVVSREPWVRRDAKVLRMESRPTATVRLDTRDGDRLHELWFWCGVAPNVQSPDLSFESTIRRKVRADGTVELPALAAGRTVQAVTAVFDSLALGPDDPFHGAPVVREVAIPASAFPSGATVDLQALAPVRVQVLDASGAPAIGARLLLASPIEPTFFFEPDELAPVAATDGSGRVVFFALPGPTCLCAIQGDEVVCKRVDVGKSTPLQTLQLQALPTLDVHVVDRDGRPGDGATFAWTTGRGPGGGEIDEQIDEKMAWRFVSWRWPQIVADDGGNARLPCFRTMPFPFRLAAWCDGQCGQVSVDSLGEPVELRLTN